MPSQVACNSEYVSSPVTGNDADDIPGANVPLPDDASIWSDCSSADPISKKIPKDVPTNNRDLSSQVFQLPW